MPSIIQAGTGAARPSRLARACVFSFALLSVAGFAIAAAGQVRAQSAVPVMVGGEADLDACGASGRVRGLKADGDNFLAVRTGPGTRYRMVDKLRNGQNVSMCDEKGDWIGIVYSRKDQRCGVGTPIARRQPYRGPCRSGWVHKSFIELMAG